MPTVLLNFALQVVSLLSFCAEANQVLNMSSILTKRLLKKARHEAPLEGNGINSCHIPPKEPHNLAPTAMKWHARSILLTIHTILCKGCSMLLSVIVSIQAWTLNEGTRKVSGHAWTLVIGHRNAKEWFTVILMNIEIEFCYPRHRGRVILMLILQYISLKLSTAI